MQENLDMYYEVEPTKSQEIVRHICNIIFKLHTAKYTSNPSIIARYANYKLTEEDKYWVEQYAYAYMPEYSQDQEVPLPREITELIHLTEACVL